MLRAIITDSFYAVVAVIAIWQIFNLILIHSLSLNDKLWAKLEYIWIIIGFMGVVSIVVENERIIKKDDLAFTEHWVEERFERLLFFSISEAECIVYQKADWMPQEEFDKRQAESDQFCQWVNEEILPILIKSKENGYERIGKYKELKADRLKERYTHERITEDIKSINEDILTRDALRKELSVNRWLGFQYTFGVILLILAFALRLTMVTRKVKLAKKVA